MTVFEFFVVIVYIIGFIIVFIIVLLRVLAFRLGELADLSLAFVRVMGGWEVSLVPVILSRPGYLTRFIVLDPSADSLSIGVSAEVFDYSVLVPSLDFAVELAVDEISVLKQLSAPIPGLRLSIAHNAFLGFRPVELTVIEEQSLLSSRSLFGAVSSLKCSLTDSLFTDRL